MNVVCIIQARLGSQRFPGKVLTKIQQKPLLAHIVNFLQYAKFVDRIVIATTNLPMDDPIYDLARSLKIDCYRGSSEDVLKRFYDCAKIFDADLIIRITGDNPLIDPEIVDRIIQLCKKTNCDYASNMLTQTFPLGYLVEAMSFSTLEKIHKTQKDSQSREHVTHHIRNHPECYSIQEVFAPETMRRPKWRLTVDFEDDLILINEIYLKLYRPTSYIKYEQVFQFLNANPQLIRLEKN